MSANTEFGSRLANIASYGAQHQGDGGNRFASLRYDWEGGTGHDARSPDYSSKAELRAEAMERVCAIFGRLPCIKVEKGQETEHLGNMAWLLRYGSVAKVKVTDGDDRTDGGGTRFFASVCPSETHLKSVVCATPNSINRRQLGMAFNAGRGYCDEALMADCFAQWVLWVCNFPSLPGFSTETEWCKYFGGDSERLGVPIEFVEAYVHQYDLLTERRKKIWEMLQINRHCIWQQQVGGGNPYEPEIAEARGSLAVDNVIALLEGLDFFGGVEESIANEPDDVLGRDLIVRLTEEVISRLSSRGMLPDGGQSRFFVQVKSCPRAVKNFMGARGGPMWRWRQSIVVVNGHSGDSTLMLADLFGQIAAVLAIRGSVGNDGRTSRIRDKAAISPMAVLKIIDEIQPGVLAAFNARKADLHPELVALFNDGGRFGAIARCSVSQWG